MDSFKESTLESFTRDLASSDPVPGGGGVSALAGALAIALGSMAASLTIGKKKYVNVEERMKEVVEDAEELRERLLRLVDDDARAFSSLMDVMKLPRGTEEERTERSLAMDEALTQSGMVPLKIMRSSADVIVLLEEIAANGSKAVLSDAACGVSLAWASMECAALNVYANTKFIRDRATAKKMNTEVLDLMDEMRERARKIYTVVEEELKNQIQ